LDIKKLREYIEDYIPPIEYIDSDDKNPNSD
jgi:hypothetical protein